MKTKGWSFAVAIVLLAGMARYETARVVPARPMLPSLPPAATQPTLRFSTFLGGADVDLSHAVALDADGYVYVVGQTLSDDFPTRNAAQGYQGGFMGSDVFVAKLNPAGDSLVYATYLGGRMGEEVATAVAVDDDGRVYVAGSTTSMDFPVQNSLHAYRGGSPLMTDAFLVRLSADGGAVEAATYLGGTGDESVTALTLDAGGAVWIAGMTNSTDFPTTGGVVQPERAGNPDKTRLDAFVARIMPDGDAFDLDVATYLGGAQEEIATGLALDADGAVWIAGTTNSGDFPLQNPLQDTYNGPIRDYEGDAFVARLTDDGATLDFATYLGGNQDDQATGLALDADGRVYLTGWTQSHDFPTTPGTYQVDRQSIRDRFAARLTPVGGSWMLDYATRLGSPGGYEMGRTGLAVDQAGRVWIAGATTSDRFPTMRAEQPGYGGGDSDGFLARLDASGAVLGYATYLGGTAGDVVTALALRNNTLCLTGSTGSPDYPTATPLQSAFDGPSTAGLTVTSAFITCFDTVNEAAALSRIAVLPDSVALIAGETVQLTAEGLDQFEQPLPVTVAWTATGGTVDEHGLYTAGDNAGLFTATATDPASGLSGTAVVNIISGVDTEDAADLPTAFALYGNYPNPFNPQTTIRFDVKEPVRVVLTLYDVLGRRQATLVERDYTPGRYDVHFNGRGWPSGTYFYVIEMGDFRAAKKMVLLR